VSQTPKYELSFSLNVLNHLGIGLYSNIPAVLSEMVANAWDAGATQVQISINHDEIMIDDNGRGMSFDD
jgi:DNA gyrase/topoisomerase IV subunit B